MHRPLTAPPTSGSDHSESSYETALIACGIMIVAIIAFVVAVIVTKILDKRNGNNVNDDDGYASNGSDSEENIGDEEPIPEQKQNQSDSSYSDE